MLVVFIATGLAFMTFSDANAGGSSARATPMRQSRNSIPRRLLAPVMPYEWFHDMSETTPSPSRAI